MENILPLLYPVTPGLKSWLAPQVATETTRENELICRLDTYIMFMNWRSKALYRRKQNGNERMIINCVDLLPTAPEERCEALRRQTITLRQQRTKMAAPMVTKNSPASQSKHHGLATEARSQRHRNSLRRSSPAESRRLGRADEDVGPRRR